MIGTLVEAVLIAVLLFTVGYAALTLFSLLFEDKSDGL